MLPLKLSAFRNISMQLHQNFYSLFSFCNCKNSLRKGNCLASGSTSYVLQYVVVVVVIVVVATHALYLLRNCILPLS